MSNAFEAIKISDRVYWVGAIDWELRNFHGYLTKRGTTYNAYLVVGDEITLVDSVKPAFMDEMLARIASVVDPSEISNIISNHAEMDHSGALPELIKRYHPNRVIASPQGKKALAAHYHWDVEVETVKTGDSLNLGGASFRFVEARMLHWPDSMFAYLEGDGVLFTNDAFGMHLATSERFADEVEETLWRREAAKYYANILLHFSPLVKRLLSQLPSLNLDLKIIAPDHGPIWRENVTQIVDLYAHWAEQLPTRKALVLYDSMWRSTALMGTAVGEGLAAGGAEVRLLPLAGTHRSDVLTELLDAGGLVIGSPTMNNQIYPTVADVMTYIKGLKPKNLVGASFGSYGWSGEAVKQLDQMLTDMKVELAAPGFRVNYVPDAESLASCRAMGRKVAERLLAKVEEMSG